MAGYIGCRAALSIGASSSYEASPRESYGKDPHSVLSGLANNAERAFYSVCQRHDLDTVYLGNFAADTDKVKR